MICVWSSLVSELKRWHKFSFCWINTSNLFIIHNVKLCLLCFSECCETTQRDLIGPMSPVDPWSAVAKPPAGLDAAPAADQHDEAKESARSRGVGLVCSMASVVTGLVVLLACLCCGRGSQGSQGTEGSVVVVMLYEQCYNSDINISRLYELTSTEAKDINSSWVIEFLPQKGTYSFIF